MARCYKYIPALIGGNRTGLGIQPVLLQNRASLYSYNLKSGKIKNDSFL